MILISQQMFVFSVNFVLFWHIESCQIVCSVYNFISGMHAYSDIFSISSNMLYIRDSKPVSHLMIQAASR